MFAISHIGRKEGQLEFSFRISDLFVEGRKSEGRKQIILVLIDITLNIFAMLVDFLKVIRY